MQFLSDLFLQHFKRSPSQIQVLPASGSQRQYFRLSDGSRSAIGVYHLNQVENQTFVAYSRHFKQHKLRVPEIYEVSADGLGYLQQDLGNTDLLSLRQSEPSPSADTVHFYQQSLSQLAYMQLYAGVDLDYSVAGAYPFFDKMGMGWDLNYFKYWLLLPSKLVFDEYRLELDFQKLLTQLDEANQAYFMFRDFQARNIMIYQGQSYFIDYQGAKQGALQYDVASLLYQSKANLPPALREQLLDFYLDEVAKYVQIDKLEFKQQYDRFVLLRLLQVLGSYGYRGFYEQKPHFISSLPYALANIAELQKEKSYLFNQIPYLSQLLTQLREKFSK